LELASSRALDAEGSRSLKSELAAIPPARWPGLRLALSASTARVEGQFDLVAVVELCDAGDREAALALASAPEATAVLVGRCGLHVYFRRLGAGEDSALRLFIEGASLADVCDELSRRDPSFRPERMLGYLQRWVADGVVGNLSLDA
jgi:hypothetical protein